MSTRFYYADANSRPVGPLTLEEIRNFAAAGVVPNDVMVCESGGDHWRSLDTIPATPSGTSPRGPSHPIPAQAIPPRQGHRPIPHGLAGSNYTFTQNPFGLTQSLKAMLWVQLGMTVISLLSDFGQMSLASSGSITTEAAEANDARQGLIGLIGAAVAIATSVLFLKWIYRANVNCRGFGAADMEFTPGWSIGYYFIPICNLTRPYRAMREIWKVSGNPMNWKAQKGSSVLGWWWTLWLISGFFGWASIRMSWSANSPSALEDATMMSIICSMIDIPLIIVAVTLISRIIERQSKLTRHNG